MGKKIYEDCERLEFSDFSFLKNIEISKSKESGGFERGYRQSITVDLKAFDVDDNTLPLKNPKRDIVVGETENKVDVLGFLDILEAKRNEIEKALKDLEDEFTK